MCVLEVKRRLIYEYRCDERLKTKNEESTRLPDTGLVVELEHLKTKTRLIDEKFVSVRENPIKSIGVPSGLRLITRRSSNKGESCCGDPMRFMKLYV